MEITYRVSIKDQYGKRHDELEDYILKARSAMCDIVNGPDGLINKWWNPMLDEVGITDKELRMSVDDVAYMTVSNAIWTAQLRALGIEGVRILDETIVLPTALEAMLGLSGTVKITIEV